MWDTRTASGGHLKVHLKKNRKPLLPLYKTSHTQSGWMLRAQAQNTHKVTPEPSSTDIIQHPDNKWTDLPEHIGLPHRAPQEGASLAAAFRRYGVCGRTHYRCFLTDVEVRWGVLFVQTRHLTGSGQQDRKVGHFKLDSVFLKDPSVHLPQPVSRSSVEYWKAILWCFHHCRCSIIVITILILWWRHRLMTFCISLFD